MNPVIAFLKLIRVQNLIIIALTQYLMRWAIIKPLIGLQDMGFEVQMDELHFFLMVLGTVMIAAAGNIINDYFDLRIDRVNKPQKIIVGRYIKRRVAMGAHIVINTLGLLIGAYVSWAMGSWKLAFIFVFGAVSLWYYATTFKKQLFVGNLVISILAGLVPVVVALYEIPLLTKKYAISIQAYDPEFNFNFIAWWILGYGIFAFFMTLAREITKDAADVRGDEKYGCQTVPIVYGFPVTKGIVGVLNVGIICLLIYLQQHYFNDTDALIYIGVAIIAPLIYSTVVLLSAKEQKQYNKSATINKYVMLMGILFSIIIYLKFSGGL